MINVEQIRYRLVEAIKQSEITQNELAKRIGVIQQSVAQYISGRAMPTIETFAKICLVLDIDSNYILGLTNYLNPKKLSSIIEDSSKSDS